MDYDIKADSISCWEVFRVMHHYSMEDMSKILGVSKQAYSLWVNKKVPLPAWMDVGSDRWEDFAEIGKKVRGIYKTIERVESE